MVQNAGLGAAAATDEQLQCVVRAIHRTRIIDNHAHPLLKPEAVGRHPLLSIVTEAYGDAIRDAFNTLAHHRSVKQLSGVLGCPPTWDSVVAAIEQRRTENYTAWIAQCLSGFETILLDDGLDGEGDVFDYSWHDSFTRSKCRRIVRIEALAAEIIDRHGLAFDAATQRPDQVFDSMLDEFDAQIKKALADPEVVAFKSIICYRTGLDIPQIVDMAAARESFSIIINDRVASGDRFRRLQHAGLSDLFVHQAAAHIRDSAGHGRKKPIQFHTGLGDNDITLTKSSPAHLQTFIRTYPAVPIVLLHSGYPYVREAGYLASTYANVYLDIGEVFPFVSHGGQENIVRQVFELCPWSKVMWSTDGHWFPESYLLAVMQVREVLETVLCDFVQKGTITWQSAIQLTRDVLFTTSNQVYQLGLQLSEIVEDDGMNAGRPGDRLSLARKPTDLQIWEDFLRDHAAPDFVRISWLDYTATPRMRMVPFRHFRRLIQAGKALDIGIAKACLGLLQTDSCIPGVSSAGEYRLHPDLSSLKPGPISGHFSMYGDFREKDGSPVLFCPRTQLARTVALSAQAGIAYLVGFEIEFVLMRRVDYTTTSRGADASTTPARLEPIVSDGHNWSAARCFADPAIPQLLRDVVDDLEAAGIEVEQLHAESAPGQFELVLPARPPVEAVDALLHARDTIAARATAAGLHFTLHPKPYAHACGTASHVHMSLSKPGGGDGSGHDKSVYEPFYAGILHHLPAIVAYTYSNPVSYERVVDNAWAGGRWVAWGTQNRETPLRKIEDSHWELKCLDGLANPYLALSAIFTAGLSGVADHRKLTWKDCAENPAALSSDEHVRFGIVTAIPASLAEALDILVKDEQLTRLLGNEVVQRYVAVKKTELSFFSGLGEAERREWIMRRY